MYKKNSSPLLAHYSLAFWAFITVLHTSLFSQYIVHPVCCTFWHYGLETYAGSSIDKINVELDWKHGYFRPTIRFPYRKPHPLAFVIMERAGWQKTDSECRAGQKCHHIYSEKAEFLAPTACLLAVQTLGACLLECTEKDTAFTMVFSQFSSYPVDTLRPPMVWFQQYSCRHGNVKRRICITK